MIIGFRLLAIDSPDKIIQIIVQAKYLVLTDAPIPILPVLFDELRLLCPGHSITLNRGSKEPGS